jgi:hypothetical protein
MFTLIRTNFTSDVVRLRAAAVPIRQSARAGQSRETLTLISLKYSAPARGKRATRRLVRASRVIIVCRKCGSRKRRWERTNSFVAAVLASEFLSLNLNADPTGSVDLQQLLRCASPTSFDFGQNLKLSLPIAYTVY